MTVDEAEKIKTVVENKDYITQLVKTVSKAMIEAFENLKIEDVNMFQLGYNKAIDDFVKALRIEYSPVSDEMQNEYDNVCLRFEKIAEQLKACGKE